MGLARKAVLRAASAHTARYERLQPEQTLLHHLVREHLETFLAEVQARTGTGLTEFVKDEFEAFLECGVLAHGFLRVRCAGCAHEKLVAFSCKRRGFCPSRGARRMARSAAILVDEVIPRVPVGQWMLSFPIGLRILFAARPELLTPVLRIVHRVIAGFLLRQAGLERATADTGALTLIQRFGSAANLNIHLHCLVLDGVYRRTGGGPVYQEARAPTGEELQGLLEKIIVRLVKALTRLGYLMQEDGMSYLAEFDSDNPLTPLQAA
ncbi:MAG: transposase [Betaproteobacteria bacterium]|nr:transposase [Betaproteobacteria bacterium]